MIPIKKDLFRAIRDYCKTCNPTPINCVKKVCPLFAYRHSDAAIQTDVFRVSDKEVFFEKVIEIAKSFGPEAFFWSELRARVNLRPLHDNWWAVSTRILRVHGFAIIDGARRSTHKSRCGAFDRRWKRFGGKKV